jgi:hypothetical protein
MFAHRFSTGQVIDSREGSLAALAGAYEILGPLACSGGDNQYWVRSLLDGDHRVVRESDLAAGSKHRAT